MNESRTEHSTISKAQKVVNMIWLFFTGKRRLIGLSVVIVTAGMTMNWSWLVAIGAAPLITALLPCAVMCVLGLCMNHGRKGAQSAESKIKKLHNDD